MRVRTTGPSSGSGGDSVCLKIFAVNQEDGTSKNFGEYETKVENGQEMLNILKGIGFTDEVVVDKTRRSFKHKNFEIEIDEVKDLGIFVEVELKEHDDDFDEGIKQIYTFVKSIGITKFKIQNRGYVSMLWNPNYSFAEDVTL